MSGCPARVVDRTYLRTVESAVWALEGIGWPVHGGVLDQAWQFVEAVRIVAHMRAHLDEVRRKEEERASGRYHREARDRR
jgi:citrate synthase